MFDIKFDLFVCKNEIHLLSHNKARTGKFARRTFKLFTVSDFNGFSLFEDNYLWCIMS